MGCVIVLGAPGVGKSTVLKGLEGKIRIMNYGDAMFSIAQKQGVKNRDDMRKLPVKSQEEIQEKAAKELAKTSERFVLDTHCSIKTPNGFLPGLPYRILQLLKVEALVLIEAPAEEILSRRANDPTRTRDEEEREALGEHLNANRSFLYAYSALCGSPAKIVVNRGGKVEEAQEELKRIVGVQ